MGRERPASDRRSRIASGALRWGLVLGLAALLVGSAPRAPRGPHPGPREGARYEYRGEPFTQVAGPYTDAQRVEGHLVVGLPLPPGLLREDVTAAVVDLHFADGVQTLRAGDARLEARILVSTDANGDVIAPWEASLRAAGGRSIHTRAEAPEGPAPPDSEDMGCSGELAFGRNERSPGAWETFLVVDPPTRVVLGRNLLPALVGLGVLLAGGLVRRQRLRDPGSHGDRET